MADSQLQTQNIIKLINVINNKLADIETILLQMLQLNDFRASLL